MARTGDEWVAIERTILVAAFRLQHQVYTAGMDHDRPVGPHLKIGAAIESVFQLLVQDIGKRLAERIRGGIQSDERQDHHGPPPCQMHSLSADRGRLLRGSKATARRPGSHAGTEQQQDRQRHGRDQGRPDCQSGGYVRSDHDAPDSLARRPIRVAAHLGSPVVGDEDVFQAGIKASPLIRDDDACSTGDLVLWQDVGRLRNMESADMNHR